MVEFKKEMSLGTTTVRNLPDWERLSTLVAIIALAFILSQYIELPVWEPSVQLPGFYIALQISSQNIVLLLVAGLTATGADWLFHDHPALAGRSTLPYSLLPALTVFGVGIFLLQLSFGIAWWVGLGIGGLFLTLVLVGEFISIDMQDIRQPFAAAILIAASFALFLVVLTGLHALVLRLFLLVPVVFGATWLVSVRSLHLRLRGEWLIYESAMIAMIVSQIAAALIYWPISSLLFSILLSGIAYALNGLLVGLIEEKPPRELWLEPLVAFAITVGIAIWIL